MTGRILAWRGIVFAICALGPRAQSNTAAPPSTKSSGQALFTNRALLDKYCVTCHNQKSATAGLMLDKMNLKKAGEDAGVLRKSSAQTSNALDAQTHQLHESALARAEACRTMTSDVTKEGGCLVDVASDAYVAVAQPMMRNVLTTIDAPSRRSVAIPDLLRPDQPRSRIRPRFRCTGSRRTAPAMGHFELTTDRAMI